MSRSALIEATARRLGSEREARWLLEEVGGSELGAAAAARLESLVARREGGEPLQHVLGHWPFRTLELVVDGRALVPRPETEWVVGIALAELRRRSGPTRALDLGTGSGAIACSLVAELRPVSVVAVDSSEAACSLAAENREHLPPDAAARLELVRGSWYEGVPGRLAGRVDCVVSNPPYLAEAEWPHLDPVVRDFDPYAALVAGPSGLEAIEAVVLGAPAVLAPGGSLVVEIAPHQAGLALELASQAGAAESEVSKDLAGRDRVLRARW